MAIFLKMLHKTKIHILLDKCSVWQIKTEIVGFTWWWSLRDKSVFCLLKVDVKVNVNIIVMKLKIHGEFHRHTVQYVLKLLYLYMSEPGKMANQFKSSAGQKLSRRYAHMKCGEAERSEAGFDISHLSLHHYFSGRVQTLEMEKALHEDKRTMQ